MTDDLPFWKEEDRWGNRSYYLAGDSEPFPSVTTIGNKGEPKTGIDYAKRKKCAEAAIDDYQRVLAPLIKAGARDQAVAYVMDAASREWQKSLDLGTTVHLVAEAMGRDWPLPDYVAMLADPIIQRLDPNDPDDETADAVRKRVTAEIEPRIIALRNFFEDWRPNITHSEFTVFSLKHRYAGTCDGVMEVGADSRRVSVLFDWKTTKANQYTGHGIYGFTACQCAAYRHADFAFDRDGTRMEIPTVDAVYGVNILKGTYRVVPLNCTAEASTCPAFRKFRAVKATAALVQNGQRELVGDPVAPPIRMEVVS